MPHAAHRSRCKIISKMLIISFKKSKLSYKLKTVLWSFKFKCLQTIFLKINQIKFLKKRINQ